MSEEESDKTDNNQNIMQRETIDKEDIKEGINTIYKGNHMKQRKVEETHKHTRQGGGGGGGGGKEGV